MPIDDTTKGKIQNWLMAPVDYSKPLIGGLGLGGGGVVVYEIIAAVEKNPAFLPQLLNVGVLGFGFATFALALLSRAFGKFTETQARSAAAQEQLAENVGALVSRSSEREREQELLVNHMAAQYQEILETLAAIKRSVTREEKQA